MTRPDLRAPPASPAAAKPSDTGLSDTRPSDIDPPDSSFADDTAAGRDFAAPARNPAGLNPSGQNPYGLHPSGPSKPQLPEPPPAGRVTLWAIEIFLAVAEEGAISAAARRLDLSPSGVSQQLTGLEAALGAQLIDRGARPLRMTPAGEMFRRHAQTMLNAAQEARADLARADLGRLTTLRLGMIEDFEADVTPRLLSGLSTALPGCRLLLETGPSHRLRDQLEARALDIVVTADSREDRGSAPWECHALLEEPFLAIYPLGRRDADLPLIHYSPRHLMGRQIAAHLMREGITASPRFELDSYHAILALVAAGEGWAILPPLALHQARRFRAEVELAPLPFAPLSRSLSLTAREGVLRDIPSLIATRLRALIEAEVIAPGLALWPWLRGSLFLPK